MVHRQDMEDAAGALGALEVLLAPCDVRLHARVVHQADAAARRAARRADDGPGQAVPVAAVAEVEFAGFAAAGRDPVGGPGERSLKLAFPHSNPNPVIYIYVCVCVCVCVCVYISH